MRPPQRLEPAIVQLILHLRYYERTHIELGERSQAARRARHARKDGLR